MDYRFAAESDLDLLAEWNYQLIRDEGHRNPMMVSELRARMAGWLASEYTAVIFLEKAEAVAYALYKENEAEVYLRQFFVRRDCRRHGIGRQAMALLREQLWPRRKRLSVSVLVDNTAALHFWRAAGFRDYALTLEIAPE